MPRAEMLLTALVRADVLTTEQRAKVVAELDALRSEAYDANDGLPHPNHVVPDR